MARAHKNLQIGIGDNGTQDPKLRSARIPGFGKVALHGNESQRAAVEAMSKQEFIQYIQNILRTQLRRNIEKN